MNKKTLLLSGLLALAATPLLIAQNVTDIFIFGNDNISDGQKVTVAQTQPSQTNTWSGDNTGVSVSFQNKSSTLAAPGAITLESNKWSDGGGATKALLEITGKDSKSDFSKITKGLYSYGSGLGSGPEVRFSGFKSGQEYEVGFWIQKGPSSGNPDLKITNLSSGLSVACYYGLLTGSDFSSSEKTITLSGQNNQYFVKYTFLANNSSSLALSFHSEQSGTASIPTFDIGLIAISAVPEPSVFGLLAGLGSVALVASRRRRRR